MSGEALLLAVGNHLAGLPKHGELLAHGARPAGLVRTAAAYRLLARGTAAPFNPGLVEAAPGAGLAIEGELYTLPSDAIPALAALVRPPIGLGQVRLEDGRRVHGYLCDPAAAATARDISHLGGWRAFLSAEAE